jgi:hypothetical protein
MTLKVNAVEFNRKISVFLSDVKELAAILNESFDDSAFRR